MSDPDDKKIRLPVRTSAPKKAIAPPVRPASLPKQTSAKMPVRSAIAQPVQAQGPIRPVMQPSTTNRPVVVPPPSRRDRLMSGVEPMPVPAPKDARVYSSSSPSTGTLELGLADLKVQNDMEFAAEKRRKWLLAYETMQNVRVTGFRSGTFEELRYFDLMVGFTATERATRTVAESNELIAQRGFRYEQEIAKLGDLHGHRVVARCESADVFVLGEVQPEVRVDLFQSPDIPAWKSRIVSSDDSGGGRVRPSGDGGLDVLKAIFEPNEERVNKLADSRWAAFVAERAGDTRSPEELSGALLKEVFDEENAAILVRRNLVEAIGPATFAGLWNSAIESCTFVASPADAAEAPVAVTDLSPTA